MVYVFLYFRHLIHKLKDLEIIGLLLTTAKSMRVTFRHLKGCHLEGRFGGLCSFRELLAEMGNFVPFKEVKAMLKVRFMRIVKLSFRCQLSIVWIINDLYFFMCMDVLPDAYIHAWCQKR